MSELLEESLSFFYEVKIKYHNNTIPYWRKVEKYSIIK